MVFHVYILGNNVQCLELNNEIKKAKLRTMTVNDIENRRAILKDCISQQFVSLTVDTLPLVFLWRAGIIASIVMQRELIYRDRQLASLYYIFSNGQLILDYVVCIISPSCTVM